jgi:hypothetical protein
MPNSQLGCLADALRISCSALTIRAGQFESIGDQAGGSVWPRSLAERMKRRGHLARPAPDANTRLPAGPFDNDAALRQLHAGFYADRRSGPAAFPHS